MMARIEEEIQQPVFPSEQIKATLNILFTANWLYNKVSANLKSYNLSHEQYNVLRILRGSHPRSMCQKDILRRMIAPSSNLTLLVKKLKDKQFIQVHHSTEDRREYVINITQTGMNTLKKIDGILDVKQKELAVLSDAEAQMLNTLLDKLRD